MYSTEAEVRSVLAGDVNVTQGKTAAVMSDEVIRSEIENADAQIDATLRSAYLVPFTEPVPTLIKRISRDIAAYLVDLDFRGNKEYNNDNYPVVRRYDRARELLEWLRNGTISMDHETLPEFEQSEVVHPYEPALFNPNGEDIFAYRSYEF